MDTTADIEYMNGNAARRAFLDEQDRIERAELARERERAELAFFESDLCSAVCCDTLIHQTPACLALALEESREFQVWYRGEAA
jgi:hypothetical protein